MNYEVYDESDDFVSEIEIDCRPAMCRNCDYGCDEPDEDGCPLMRL